MRATLISVCFLIAISVGCQEAPLGDLKGSAQEAIEDAREKARALRELSAEELQAIWAIEYKTIEVTHSDLAALDEQLNELDGIATTSVRMEKERCSTSREESPMLLPILLIC